MEQHNYIVVFITTRDAEEAEKIGKTLVKRRQAACVNIVPGAVSHYWWQGKIESGQESLLIVKTRASLFSDLVDTVKSLHSYEVPEIIAVPVVNGNPEYLKWIDESVAYRPDGH